MQRSYKIAYMNKRKLLRKSVTCAPVSFLRFGD